MLRLSVKGLWAHKRRTVGVALAVFVGVAFLAGTLVLGDTMRGDIHGLIGDADRGTDAVVRNATSVDDGPGAERSMIPAAVLARVRAVPGVARAVSVIDGFGQIVGSDGKAISQDGPRVATTWVGDPALNPYRIVNGRAPRADDEVVINRAAADSGHLHAGDTTTVMTPRPVRVRVVGIAKFGSVDAYGGSSLTAFTLRGAQRYLATRRDRISKVEIVADPGVRQDELVSRIRSVLPHGVEAITGAKLTREDEASVDDAFLNGFRSFLTAFAVIALIVAMFSIYNAFSIIAAQRAREWGLLRAVGATRRQILGATLLEAGVVGAVASTAGVPGGLVLAMLLKGAFAGLGFALPASGIVLTPTTVAIALPVGIVVSVLSALVPARRSARIAPLAALRDAAARPAVPSRRRSIAGSVLTLGGVAGTLIAALTATDGSGGMAGIGAALTLIGMLVLGPAAASRVFVLLGTPFTRLGGVNARLARRNATRDPRRTAGAAAALLVGVTVIALFTVFAASIRASIDDTVAGSLTADLVITPGGGFSSSGLSPRVATDVASVPGVAATTALANDAARVAGASQQITIVDPRKLRRALHIASGGSLGGLHPGQLAVSAQVAHDRGWRAGTSVRVTFADGATTTETIAAVYPRNDILGDYVLPRAAWTPHVSGHQLDASVFVTVEHGADPRATRAAVERAVHPYGAPKLQDRAQYIDSKTAMVRALLNIVYAMLVLAVLIAVIGISNTLSLSIHERARELGMLRAVGQTRRQLRAMIRWESTLIATFGSIGGLAIGVFAGWGLVRGTSASTGFDGFAAPPAQLAIVLAIGGLAGILAALRPARRAARRNVLAAISTE